MGSSEDRQIGALWSFAVAFYQRPGLEPLLLAMQDEDGLDVPLLLALLYAGTQGIELAREQLGALHQLAAAWQTKAITPLRSARRALKAPLGGPVDAAQESLRAQIKAAELDAERLLLNRLEDLLPPAGTADRHGAIRANLGIYLAVLRPGLSEASRRRLAQLAIEAA
jgi:uncharacterized protein (TIGR02444 family)